jgi:drug/metabolite transporter (DMT)-like permease
VDRALERAAGNLIDPTARSHATAAAFGVLCLIWSLAFVVFHVGLREVPPLTFTVARAIVAGMSLVAYLLVTGQGVPGDRRAHLTTLVLGAVNVAAFQGLQAMAIQRISAGEAAILIYLQPLLVALGAWLFLSESLVRRQIVGLVVGFAGVATVLGAQAAPRGGDAWLGYLFGVGAALGWAGGTILFKRFAADLDLLQTAALQSLYGALPLVPLAILFEGFRFPLTFGVVWTSLYAGLGASALASVIWFSLLRRHAATRVSSWVFLVPLLAVLFDALLLGSRLGIPALVGGALVIGGIWLVNK